jgi:hypothetical protein
MRLIHSGHVAVLEITEREPEKIKPCFWAALALPGRRGNIPLVEQGRAAVASYPEKGVMYRPFVLTMKNRAFHKTAFIDYDRVALCTSGTSYALCASYT